MTRWTVRRLLATAAGTGLVAFGLVADGRWVERHVLASYCAESLPAWTFARAAPALALALGIAVIAWLAPAWGRRPSRAAAPGAGALLPIALAVIASLGIVELHMRRLHARLAPGGADVARAGGGAPMTRPDPRLGWSYWPRRTTWVELGGRRIAYAIDADGDRARSEDDVSDPSRPAILLAGESIAFGYGLTHDESVAAELGRDLHVPVVNLAVVGYGNDQAHLRVLAALARHRAPLAVVTVFVPEQIRRNVEPWRPRLALAPGGGLARGADGEPALVPAAGGPRVARLLGELPYHGDGPLDLTAAILRATADAARAHGAVPLFVVTNYRAACRHGEGEEPWVVDRLFVRQRLPFVRVDLGPDDRLPGWFEGHPNAAGARKIAAAVGRALREQLGARLAAARDGG